MDIFHTILHRYWGYDSFRPLQEDIIHSVFSRKDTLGLMPTGGGKSLTFQVPAMAMDGLCLVVTPLISLMKDQVDNLRGRGIRALAVYSGMTHQEIITTLENAIFGDYKFLYVSPERLRTELFLAKMKEMNVNMLVVDESHCISQWGYDFRPSYLEIAKIRELLPDVPVLALTASATPEVVDDIQNQLQFREKNVFKTSFERSNLAYIIKDSENKIGDLIRILERVAGTSVVYVRSRNKTKEVADMLCSCGIQADFYHAGLNNREKGKKQNAWKVGECRVIVATNAFGMGIDKPDVRSVVHLDLPNSIEEYFQEAGRGGRDGKKSYAVILYNKADNRKLKKRIKDEFPEKDFIYMVYEKLAYFFQVAEGFGLNMTYDFSIHQFCSAYKLPILPTHNALRILDLAGYIEYVEEVDNRSRLIFRIHRDELYRYAFDRHVEAVVSTALRLYTGVFTDYVTIDEDAIAARSDMTRPQVYEILKSLSKQNVIDYIPHKKTPLITYRTTRLDAKLLRISDAIYTNRQSRFETRILAMSHYAEQNVCCRSRILLSYFGQPEVADCGHCDVCIAKAKKPVKAEGYTIIKEAIFTLLAQSDDMPIKDLLRNLSQFDEADVLTVLRFEMQNDKVTMATDKVSLRKD